MDSLKKSLIREVRLSWGGGGSPPQKNFFLWLLLDFFFTQVSMPAVMLTNRMVKVMLMRWSSGRKKLLHDEHPHGPNKIGCLEKHHLEKISTLITASLTQTVVNVLSTASWRGVWNLLDDAVTQVFIVIIFNKTLSTMCTCCNTGFHSNNFQQNTINNVHML